MQQKPLADLAPELARERELSLRLNAYRVLLTRGRDGAVVFVPPGPEMDSTFAALCRAGFETFS